MGVGEEKKINRLYNNHLYLHYIVYMYIIVIKTTNWKGETHY